MLFINVLVEVGMLIILAYLTFTNTIADEISAFLYPETAETITMEQEIILDLAEAKKSTVPNILRDNSGFQQAATIASKFEETAGDDLASIPIDTLVKDTLVNVYCQYKTPEYIRTTTGSGYVINPKGIIITNAHVAQFLLLEDVDDRSIDVECVIRMGDPATPIYEAELLYISPTWIFDNASLITSESPRGTGERDYALLYIAKSITSEPLPARFPAIPVDTALLARGIVGSTVISAGYPAEELLRKGADAKLPLVFADSEISSLYTFGSNYADIFAISGSPVGEHGASGGPVVRQDTKHAIGLIVTKGDEKLEGSRSLRALTLSYIDRTMLEETGFSLQQNMQGDVALRGNIFKSVMTPFLSNILTESLVE